MVKLRDYQQALFDKTTAAFKRGDRKVLVVAPCGAGKSYLFAKMAERSLGETLILTHRQELLVQHAELMAENGIKNYRIAMIMTEANRLGQYPRPNLIIADEAHLSRSRSWQKVIEFYNTFTVGLTATPCRLDGKPLGDIYDSMVEEISVKELISRKCLAPFKYYAPIEIDTSEVSVRAGDYALNQLEKLMMEKAVYGDVIKNWKEIAGGEKTIAYCVTVKHAEQVAEDFRAAGVSAEAISGETPPKKRAEIMRNFRSGKVTMLCNVGIISEGVSINDVTCCLLLRATESIALGIQQMMRCMRYLPGKQAKIIDCVGNYTRIGLPDEDRDWSLEKSVKKRKLTDSVGNFPVRTCPACYMAFRTAAVCPYCGEEYPLDPREIKAHEEVGLKQIQAEEVENLKKLKKLQRQEVGRARSLEELIEVGKSRGYKNPTYWAMQVMRGRKR